MPTKFALFAVFSVCILASDFANAQNRIPTKPISYRPTQAKVVNIFSLPQDPTPQDPTSENPLPTLQNQADPFSDLPTADDASEVLQLETTEPVQEEPATPIFDPFAEPPVKPSLDDMPLNVDPFDDRPLDDRSAPPELKSISPESQELETLPAPAKPAANQNDVNDADSANATVGSGVSWINLNSPMPVQQFGSSYKSKINRGLPMASYRRPTPPTPTINVLQPAMIHVPVHIQVIPSYVGYPYFAPYPTYIVPKQTKPAIYDSSEYYGNPKPNTDLHNTDLHNDFSYHNYSYHVPTDQPLNYNQDPNLVGNTSRSINYAGYPLNYFSYPAAQYYGVHIQSFPVTRRLDR